MFFNKTKRKGENHNLTEEKERWEGGIGQVNSVSNARRYCESVGTPHTKDSRRRSYIYSILIGHIKEK